MDPMVALQAKPTVDIQSDQDLTQSASFIRWVYSVLYSNRTSDWGKFLSLLSVKYLIVRLDADMRVGSNDLSAFTLANTLSAWSTQSGLKLAANFSSVLVYENPSPLPVIYQTNGYSVVSGDRNVLLSLVDLGFNFSQYPPAFIDDNLGGTDSLLSNSQFFFFQGDPYWSMLVSEFGEESVVKPWNYVGVSASPEGKWVDGALMWYLYGGDLNAATDGYIYTEGANTVTLPLNVRQTGEYYVLAQVYDGLPGSKGIRFTIDSNAGYVYTPTRSADGFYSWTEIGNSTLSPGSQLQISCLGGSAAISKIAVLPANMVAEAEQNVSRVLDDSGVQTIYFFGDREWNFNVSALVVDPQAANGRLIDLSKSHAETGFYVFNQGVYTLNLTFQNPRETATVDVHVDDYTERMGLAPSTENSTKVSSAFSVDLAQGYHNIVLEGESGKALLDLVTLSRQPDASSAFFGDHGVSEVPRYTVRSDSQYTVYPTAKYLAFLYASNDYWVLQGSNGSAQPIFVFNYASLFPVGSQGGEVTLVYLGFTYLQQSLLVAVPALVVLSAALIFPYVKRASRRVRKNGD